jgi:hypothetical protein
MFVDVPVVHTVHMPVMQVIGVIAMRDCEMAAVRSVLVVVLFVSRVHFYLLESVCAAADGPICAIHRRTASIHRMQSPYVSN